MNSRQVPQQRNTESALLRVTSDLLASLNAITRSCNFNSAGPLCCFLTESISLHHVGGIVVAVLRLSHGWALDEKISESEMPVHTNHIIQQIHLFFFVRTPKKKKNHIFTFSESEMQILSNPTAIAMSVLIMAVWFYFSYHSALLLAKRLLR